MRGRVVRALDEPGDYAPRHDALLGSLRDVGGGRRLLSTERSNRAVRAQHAPSYSNQQSARNPPGTELDPERDPGSAARLLVTVVATQGNPDTVRFGELVPGHDSHAREAARPTSAANAGGERCHWVGYSVRSRLRDRDVYPH